MKSIRIFCIITCFIMSSMIGIVSGQKATIVFNADCKISVDIFKPIDGSCDFSELSDRLELSPDISITYRLDVPDFSFVKIAYSNGYTYTLIVLKNDEIQLTFKDNNLLFEGNNSGGNVYLNTFRRYAHVDSIFDLHLEPKVDIAGINEDLNKIFWNGFNEDLDSLKSDKNISPEFIRILSNDIGYAIGGQLVDDYYVVLSGKKGRISSEDSLSILAQIDSIYKKYPPESNDVLKYRFSTPSGYLSRYYIEKFDRLSLQAKNELIQEYGTEAFGPYLSYLSAPDHIQLPMFGSAFLTQFNFMVNEFDRDKMLKYLEGHFPESQYLELIKKRMKETQINEGKANDKIILIDEEVNTLEELFSIDALKGKPLFIDIWATWCAPCKMEFKYANDLSLITKKYDVNQVYISIDQEEFKKKWESDIYAHKLNGYHLLANKSLLKNIKEIIFDNQSLVIPRYLYINEKGDIINDNAPRPSAIDNVEKMFMGK